VTPPSPSTTDKVLNIRAADIYRGPKKVFENLNLSIDVGECTAILGPNGAGKTTLLKLLARELYPSSGVVEIYGQQRWNVWELRKRLGIVSGDLQQNYSRTATGEAVVLSGFYSSVDTFGHQSFTNTQIETARRVSSELEIDSFSQRPFAKMSTGEQRRHLLARALVNDPATLILDEPTAGLDLAGQFHYLSKIRDLIRAGKTIVLVTHQVHEIPPEIRNVVLLKEGRVELAANKDRALTSKNLSDLFGTPLNIVSANGYFQVLPA